MLKSMYISYVTVAMKVKMNIDRVPIFYNFPFNYFKMLKLNIVNGYSSLYEFAGSGSNT